MSTVERIKPKILPPLKAGQHLDQPTFHERYEAMPPGTRAELIGHTPADLFLWDKPELAKGWFESLGREELVRDHALGEATGVLHALTAKRVLDEGLNVPQIDTAYILASTTVEKQWVQRRGLSPAGGDPALRQASDAGDRRGPGH